MRTHGLKLMVHTGLKTHGVCSASRGLGPRFRGLKAKLCVAAGFRSYTGLDMTALQYTIISLHITITLNPKPIIYFPLYTIILPQYIMIYLNYTVSFDSERTYSTRVQYNVNASQTSEHEAWLYFIKQKAVPLRAFLGSRV